MATGSVTVRPAEARDEAGWRHLWCDFCAFNDVSLPEEVTATTWQRILDATSPVNALVALDAAGELVGFANYVLHLHTWSAQTVCYLEDFFIAPNARNKKTGQAVIERLIAMGRESGWRRIYCHTHADNVDARRFYDRFMDADDLVHFTVQI